MISVLIITKNEEEVIDACIKSVKNLADEVIVVDGGSEDKTIEIAEKHGAKIVKNKFKNFADQRNLAASAAHEPWILYIDSDERVTPEFTQELKRKIESAESNVGGFYVKRKTFFYGKDWHFTDRVQRVFKKDKLRGWHGVVHETPEVEAKLLTVDSPILHYTHRNFEQMIAKTNAWSDFEADLRFHSKHPKMSAWRFSRVMLTAFLASYFKDCGYKNGTAGVIEGMYQSFSMFITYAKLWEKQQEK